MNQTATTIIFKKTKSDNLEFEYNGQLYTIAFSADTFMKEPYGIAKAGDEYFSKITGPHKKAYAYIKPFLSEHIKNNQ